MDQSSDDDDFNFQSHNLGSNKFPVHDCCEFEDPEALRRLIFVPQDDSDNDDDDGDRSSQGQSNHDDDSSSDDNDSTDAMKAAAIGHSPKPIMPPATVSADRAEGNTDETNDVKPETEKEVKPQHESLESNISPAGEENGANGGVAPALATESMNEEPKVPAPPKPKRPKEPTYYCPFDLNERDDDENTPIHVAIHCRKLQHVKLLLMAGASVQRKCDGSFPIHTAISMGALESSHGFALDCVDELIKAGADVTFKDDALHTPLYLACVMNLPKVVELLLSIEAGKSTLNAKADRGGGRALHAAAKFDIADSPARRASMAAAVVAATKTASQNDGHRQHHPDGSSASVHVIPGDVAEVLVQPSVGGKAVVRQTSETLKQEAVSTTQVLLTQEGIEIDAQDSQGKSALHVACMKGNWPVVRLLIQSGARPDLTDRRGYTPGQLAHKRGLLIPNDLIAQLGDAPTTGLVPPPRDLIVDPDSSTLLISHELCMLHRSCPPIRRDAFGQDVPPENVRRLHVLVNESDGILRTNEFKPLVWESHARRAAMADVLKCHEYNYVQMISDVCSKIADHPTAIANLDADTAVSRWSFEAAMRAVGGVCEAVDMVMSGEHRNAFCPVRPPGHHAGPRGIVTCPNDPDGGSHGFCLLNNVAIGAAYARTMYRNDGIKKIAIIDFDVHHGNGTEEIIRQLVPGVDLTKIRTPFAEGHLQSTRYRPWLDETDVENVFFASTHGYGTRGHDDSMDERGGPPIGWFYPASGETVISDAITNPAMVESPSIGEFILSQTWTRMSEHQRLNCCKVINCGLGLPSRDAVPGMQRLEVRDTYRKNILPHLREFDPDLIFISAGFDAHKKDTMNFGYVGMVEDDYEWLTEQLVKIANTCCNGRIISVLEGGYRIHGGIVSPFARSVASHVRALVDGGKSRELYDPLDIEWEAKFERHILEERERKRQQKRAIQEAMLSGLNGSGDDSGEPTRKRRRNQVDYRELYQQMKQEGFAG